MVNVQSLKTLSKKIRLKLYIIIMFQILHNVAQFHRHHTYNYVQFCFPNRISPSTAR